MRSIAPEIMPCPRCDSTEQPHLGSFKTISLGEGCYVSCACGMAGPGGWRWAAAIRTWNTYVVDWAKTFL